MPEQERNPSLAETSGRTLSATTTESLGGVATTEALRHIPMLHDPETGDNPASMTAGVVRVRRRGLPYMTK